jgi:hypothetical protein
LATHPEVFIPPRELNFFDAFYDRGIQWYHGQFAGAPAGTVLGEKTPDYLYAASAAARIKETIPDVLLIACLRNPIERAFSQYGLQVRAARHALSFEDALERYPDYLERGLYHKQLVPYLRLFGRRRMLLLIYEDIRPDPRAFIRRVYSFVGVDPAFVPRDLQRRVNRGTTRHGGVTALVIRLLSRIHTRSPALQAVVSSVQWAHLGAAVVDGALREASARMKPETRLRLDRQFAHSNRRLSVILQRDLSQVWR